MPAHPANLTRGVALHESVIGNIFRHNRACADEAVAAELDPANDGGVRAHRSATPKDGFLVQRVTVHLRTGVRDVREHRGRPQKDIVFDFDSGINRNIVLDLHVVADDDTRGDLTVLAEDATLPDLRAFHNVREVPDLRARPDFTWFVDDRCRV